MTRQVGNEIDEFVTERAAQQPRSACRSTSPTINMARGRDTGVPSLNAARRDVLRRDGQLRAAAVRRAGPTSSSALRHPESLVNFIAAYGTHPSITGATTHRRPSAPRRRPARDAAAPGDPPAGRASTSSTAPAHWANTANGVTTTGVDDIDLWVGGLAEKQMPFGGLLGSTFNFVFETQMEKLQDGDRFYYLSRTAGLNFLTQLEDNSFAELIMRNTDVEAAAGRRLLAAGLHVRGRPGSAARARSSTTRTTESTSPTLLDPACPTARIRFNGAEHVVSAARASGETGSAPARATTRSAGNGGNDRLEGGDGNDDLIGGRRRRHPHRPRSATTS